MSSETLTRVSLRAPRKKNTSWLLHVVQRIAASPKDASRVDLLYETYKMLLLVAHRTTCHSSSVL